MCGFYHKRSPSFLVGRGGGWLNTPRNKCYAYQMLCAHISHPDTIGCKRYMTLYLQVEKNCLPIPLQPNRLVQCDCFI